MPDICPVYANLRDDSPSNFNELIQKKPKKHSYPPQCFRCFSLDFFLCLSVNFETDKRRLNGFGARWVQKQDGMSERGLMNGRTVWSCFGDFVDFCWWLQLIFLYWWKSCPALFLFCYLCLDFFYKFFLRHWSRNLQGTLKCSHFRMHYHYLLALSIFSDLLKT